MPPKWEVRFTTVHGRNMVYLYAANRNDALEEAKKRYPHGQSFSVIYAQD